MYDHSGVSDLHKYVSAKLCDSEYTNYVILEAERCVQGKYDDILNGELNSKVMSEAIVKRYTSRNCILARQLVSMGLYPNI